MRVLYLAHDQDDAAIWRRVEMLRHGGAEVVIAGFRRGAGALPSEAVVLGRTIDGKLASRVGLVARLAPRIGKTLASALKGTAPDVILARNLEMLALARCAALTWRPRPSIVYELLDIHRMMLRRDAVGWVLRHAEAALMRPCRQIWISSPGFVTHYLAPFQRDAPETLLVENKPLPVESSNSATLRLLPVEEGRITIGWFGILRCAWSLETLDALTRANPGRYSIVLRGKPARDALPDFDATVAANPDMNFHGAYAWPDDLPGIYGGCDLAWLIDRFDAGANSDWLLPNRLYEGALNGAVPIVLAGTQSDWTLAEMGFGIRVGQATLRDAREALDPLTAKDVVVQRDLLAALPRSRWEAGEADCARLVEALRCAAVATSQAPMLKDIGASET